jgi:hypothetical protein
MGVGRASTGAMGVGALRTHVGILLQMSTMLSVQRIQPQLVLWYPFLQPQP